jgi:hypothetical protein
MSKVHDLSKHPVLTSIKKMTSFSINDGTPRPFTYMPQIDLYIEQLIKGDYSFQTNQFITLISSPVYSILFNQLLDSETTNLKNRYVFKDLSGTKTIQFS